MYPRLKEGATSGIARLLVCQSISPRLRGAGYIKASKPPSFPPSLSHSLSLSVSRGIHHAIQSAPFREGSGNLALGINGNVHKKVKATFFSIALTAAHEHTLSYTPSLPVTIVRPIHIQFIIKLTHFCLFESLYHYHHHLLR